MVRGRHTIKFGVDIRREALDVLNPPNPTGSFTINTTGTNNPTGGSGGNALASLLLGQVNAFTIDIQKQLIQERAHIAEFFVGDDWKVSPRLTLNIGTRYTLNFPSTEVHNQGAMFNLNTQVLDFPHTARELECCDFGPRLGLALPSERQPGGPRGLRHRLFSSSPESRRRSRCRSSRSSRPWDSNRRTISIRRSFFRADPTVQVTAPNANSGLGQGVFGVQRNNGSGYSQQWNFTIQKTFGRDWNFEAGYLGSKNTRLGIPEANMNQLPAAGSGDGSRAAHEGGESLLRPDSGIFVAGRRRQSRSSSYCVRFPDSRRSHCSAITSGIRRTMHWRRSSKSASRTGLTFTVAFTFSKLIDDASSVFLADDLQRAGFEQHRSGRRL